MQGWRIFSKESRQSAHILGHVLNFPLYDGDCSPAARKCLEAGDVEGAIAAWRRLADLGSGRARCILAYIALKGTPATPPDFEEARRLALSALSGERGYANYLLACIALKEKRARDIAPHLVESSNAGFVPATTMLATLSLASRQLSETATGKALSLLRRAAAAGHRPAEAALCRAYLRGRLGLAHRFLGVCLYPVTLVRIMLSLKYRVFSINSFAYVSTPSPIFSDVKVGKKHTAVGGSAPLLIVTHLAAAILAASVLLTRSNSIGIGWVLLNLWPYGLSFLTAVRANASRWIAATVQTLLLILITSLTCSVYLGQLLDLHLDPGTICVLTIVQAVLLRTACSIGSWAAHMVEIAPEAASAFRKPLTFTMIVLGVVASASVFGRPEFRTVQILGARVFELASDLLMSLLPYAAAALFTWRFAVTNLVRPWVYLGIVGMGTVMAIISNVGLGVIQPGYVSVNFMISAQLLFYVVAARWALEEEEL